MSILRKIVEWTKNVEELGGVSSALEEFLDAKDPIDTAATASKLAAELAVGGLVAIYARTILPSVRLGLAISGQIWKWEALTWAAGASSGVTAGELIDAINDLHLGGRLYDWTHPNPLISTTYLTATSTRPPRRDPLAIDLDGDGIETRGIGATPITFDHNADGVRTGTGWLTGDDAWLVLDRNANGRIDTGRELFGVDTLKADGTLARSGVDALRDLDGNVDGVFDARDAAFSAVQLWQDTNQDGISQADELSRLADHGIAAIDLTDQPVNADLADGNHVASTVVVTHTDGTSTASNLHLLHNPFHRSFDTAVAPSENALALPEMGGAGWVRDLREAMSLSEQQGQRPGTAGALIDLVQAFAVAGTQAGQMALLDDLIRAWAASNEFVSLAPVDDPLRRFVAPGNADLSAKMQAIIPVLEIFNGLGVAKAGMQSPVLSSYGLAEGGTRQVQTYTLFAEQVAPMLNAYEQLRQSVYGALVMQTRLKPYLDAIELVIDKQGFQRRMTRNSGNDSDWKVCA